MISEFPSGSRSQNIGGTGPPQRVTSSSTSAPRSLSAAWSASTSEVSRQIPVWLPPASWPCGGGARAIVVGVPASRDLDPTHRLAHRDVDDLLEAERADVEVDRTIGVGNGDADPADLREIELGCHVRHVEPPVRRDLSLRQLRERKLIGVATLSRARRSDRRSSRRFARACTGTARLRHGWSTR